MRDHHNRTDRMIRPDQQLDRAKEKSLALMTGCGGFAVSGLAVALGIGASTDVRELISAKYSPDPFSLNSACR